MHPYPSEPIRVIHVNGSDLEIGRQHAEQVGPSAGRGMATFYYEFWRRLLANEPPGFLEKHAFRAGTYVIDRWLAGRLLERVPDFARDRVRGVAESIGRPFEQLASALVLPDLLPLLQAYLVKVKPGAFLEAMPPRFGCSSFIYGGGRFLHGRNLDFPGGGYWDRYPVIQETRRPGMIPYIGFTTAGVPICGISGVNEAQISVSLHQHYCRETSLKGTLPFVISEEILSRARTLDDAIDILRDSTVATSWAFVVTDGKKRDGFILECHPRACGLRRLRDADGVLAHANYFQSSECQPSEYATTARMNWDNYWRKTRLEQLVREAGDLEPADGAKFLSDHYDPFWEEEKILNRTISQVHNIQSFVLDPAEMRVWLAAGDSPVHLSRYQEFDLGRVFAGETGATGKSCPGYQFTDDKKRVAKAEYTLSFVAAFDGRNEEAEAQLSETLENHFFPEGAHVAGVLNLRLGRYERAEAWFVRARTHLEQKVEETGKRFPPEYFETSLFYARTLDLRSRRTEALRVYDAIATHPDLEDANLRNLARRAGPYHEARLGRVIMPYFAYIPFE